MRHTFKVKMNFLSQNCPGRFRDISEKAKDECENYDDYPDRPG